MADEFKTITATTQQMGFLAHCWATDVGVVTTVDRMKEFLNVIISTKQVETLFKIFTDEYNQEIKDTKLEETEGKFNGF
jgi:hypothetical protein